MALRKCQIPIPSALLIEYIQAIMLDLKQNKKHNTICVGHHYTQTNTNNVNKTRALLQTTGSKKEAVQPKSSKQQITHISKY
jgi:hypothetical protein